MEIWTQYDNDLLRVVGALLPGNQGEHINGVAKKQKQQEEKEVLLEKQEDMEEKHEHYGKSI